VAGDPREAPGQRRVQPRGVRDAAGVDRVLRPIDPGEGRQRGERLPLGVVADGEVDVAVAGRVDADRREELVTAAAARDLLTETLDGERRDEPGDGAS